MEPLLMKRPEAAKALGISNDILRFAQRLAQKGVISLAE